MSDKQDKSTQLITLESNDHSMIEVGKFSPNHHSPLTLCCPRHLLMPLVERCVAERSMLIKNMIEDLGDDAVASQPIPIPNVNDPVLRKVIEWCTKHKNDAPQTAEEENDNRKKTTDPIEEWDQKFMQVDQEMLFEIILVCSYILAPMSELRATNMLSSGCQLP